MRPRICPRGGHPVARTLDENSGTMRYRCEMHDVEECGDCGAWVAYDDEHGWFHLVPGTPGCFLHPESPAPLAPLVVGARVRAVWPNAGDGTIVDVLDAPHLKPYVVRPDHGDLLAYYHPGQLFPLEEDPDA